ncbi:MAG: ATP-binding cassette domain-containing protein [Ilumatobacteraceae bacterium]|jgi:ATPase subunit of ABC transporter with duplicated ATPase domains|nr:ATP-binding cassette domain-containing protein [Ilumatobacteraceae bacterium]
MLQVQNVTVEVGGKNVVQGATFTVMARDKVGIVGRNGAGKTSMFRVLGGENDPAAGKVMRSGAFGYLSQDPRTSPEQEARSAIGHVLSGRNIDSDLARLEKLRVVMEQDPSDKNVAKFSKAEEEFTLKGGYSAESEARSIAAGLGLKEDRLDLALGVLSGGERRRVELARILFAGSDMLLLDEPTNHLDIDAKTWLLNFLRNYKGALLVISHDLELLDEAITRVIHLDRPDEDDTGMVYEYRGTYTQYKRSRAEDESRAEKKASLQAKEVARLQEVVDRFGAKASKATMAHSIEKRIARIEGESSGVRKKDRALTVKFPPPPQSGITVVTTKGLSKGYGGPAIFEDVSFDLGRGERLLVLGLNGAGKTSLLRILAGATQANIGDIEWGYKVEVGYFAQEHDTLDPNQSLIWHMRRELPAGSALTETQMRALLGMFGLQGSKVFQESGSLSGGEKTKLALAMLMVGRNNVLLLDEPTNNLDPASREAVADALESWPGSIIMVSHDEEFVQRLKPTKVILMPDGQVDYFSKEWLDLVSLS